jgi:hypothetical protein
MKRWHARVTESKSFEPRDVDDFYAFFICCFHLKDWLKNDPGLDASIGREAERLVNTRTVAFRLCADVTNGSKHFSFDRPPRHSADAHLARLLTDFDPFPDIPFDPEQEMIIVYADGVAWPALWIANRCVQVWEKFLVTKRLLPPS